MEEVETKKIIFIDFDNTLVDYDYNHMSDHLFFLFKKHLDLEFDKVPKYNYVFGEKKYLNPNVSNDFVYLNEVFIIPAYWCQRYLVEEKKFENSEAWSKVFSAMKKVFKDENEDYNPIIKDWETPVTKWLLEIRGRKESGGCEESGCTFVMVTNSPKWIVDRVQKICGFNYIQHFDHVYYSSNKPSFFKSVNFKEFIDQVAGEEVDIYMIGDGILSDNISAKSFAKNNGIEINTVYYNTKCKPNFENLMIDEAFLEVEKNLKTFETFLKKFDK